MLLPVASFVSLHILDRYSHMHNTRLDSSGSAKDFTSIDLFLTISWTIVAVWTAYYFFLSLKHSDLCPCFCESRYLRVPGTVRCGLMIQIQSGVHILYWKLTNIPKLKDQRAEIASSW